MSTPCSMSAANSFLLGKSSIHDRHIAWLEGHAFDQLLHRGALANALADEGPVQRQAAENIDSGDQKALRVVDTVPAGLAVAMQPPGRIGTAWGDHPGAIEGDKATRAPGMPKNGLQCLHAENQGMQDISQHGSGQFFGELC